MRFNFVFYRKQKMSREYFDRMNAGQSYDTIMRVLHEFPENMTKFKLWEWQRQVKVLFKNKRGTERSKSCGILHHVDW